MSLDFTPEPQAELEARLTALLLRELTGAEAASLRQAIEDDPQLAALYQRLQQTVVLVRKVSANPAEPALPQTVPLKLSEDRRQKLLALFKTVRPKEFSAPPKSKPALRLLEWAAVLAFVAVLASLLLPSLAKSKSKATSLAIVNNLRQLDGAKQQWAFVNKAAPSAEPTFEQIKPYLGRGPAGSLPPSIAGEKYVLGPVGKAPVAVIEGRRAKIITIDGGLTGTQQSQALAELSTLSPRHGNSSFGRQRELAIAQNGKPAEVEFQTGGGRASVSSPGAPASQRLQIFLPPAQPADDAPQTAGAKLEVAGKSVNSAVAPSSPISTAELPPAQFGLNQIQQPPLTTAPGSENSFADGETLKRAPSSGLETREYRLTEDALRKGTDSVQGVPFGNGTVSAGGGGTGRGFSLLGPKKENPTPFLSDDIANGKPALGEVPKLGVLSPTNHGYEEEIKRAPVASGQHNSSEANDAQNRADLFSTLSLPPPNAPAATPSSGYVGPSGQWNLGTVNGHAPDYRYGGTSVTNANTFYFNSAPNDFAELKSSVPDAKLDGITTIFGKRKAYLLPETLAYASSNANIQYPQSTTPGEATFGIDPETHSLVVMSDTTAKKDLEKTFQELDQKSREIELASKQEIPNVDNTWKGRTNSLAYINESRNGALGRSVDQANARETAVLAYEKEKQKLENLKKFRDVLALRTFQESVEVTQPKSSLAEVIEHAEAAPTSDSGVFERMRRAVTGTVERRARIKIEGNLNDVGAVASKDNASSYNPHFVQNESEVIQSEPVLDQVITKLKLDEAWAKRNGGQKLKMSEARQMLKSRLDLKGEKNTSLLDIGVKSDKPEEAALIANTMADVYTEFRKGQKTAETLVGVKQTEMQVVQLDKKISDAQKELSDLSQSNTNKDLDKSDAPLQKPTVPAPEPQPEVLTSTNAFSTFSLNVADVSFKLAAASFEKGVMPDAASIRSEEFINAFDYRDPEAGPGVPIAFAWERVRYPFAQNRDLLRFSLKTAATGRAPGRPLNIVLLLDNSGSMERADRVQIIHEALRVLAAQLQPQDTLSIVTFARTARLFVDGISGSQAADAVEKVSGLTPEGGTNLEDAMKLAYETAFRHYYANGVNRVVLLTDGAANLGNVDPGALKAKVEANRKQGVALDCFGIGWEGYNDDLLEVLARNGDGRYGFLNTPEEAATGFAHQLAGALNVAAADVKVQVEFNPARVTVYRQIGYAKLQLTKEQFRDNTVDAAEIGAAEAGNALYVLEVNPNGDGPLGTVRVRYKVPGTQDFHEHEWSVPYTGSAISLEQSSPAMRLAATASAFSEWLANSPYAAEVTPDALLHQINGVPEIYGADTRPQKLEWMVRQAKSLTGK